jgi:hypothetical protein
MGTPNKYNEALHPRLAEAVAKMGGSLNDIAEACEVSPQAVDKWMVRWPEFAAATRVGWEASCARLERSLYQRALGGPFKTQKAVGTGKGVEVVEVEEYLPGDVNAAKWLLASRAPDKWKLNPPSRPQLNLGTLEGAAGLLEGAKAALLAIADGRLDAQDGLRVVDAIERLGMQLERRETEARVTAIEQGKIIDVTSSD